MSRAFWQHGHSRDNSVRIPSYNETQEGFSTGSRSLSPINESSPNGYWSPSRKVRSSKKVTFSKADRLRHLGEREKRSDPYFNFGDTSKTIGSFGNTSSMFWNEKEHSVVFKEALKSENEGETDSLMSAEQEYLTIDQKILKQNLENTMNPVLWNKILYESKRQNLSVNLIPRSLQRLHIYQDSYNGVSRKKLIKLYLAKCKDLGITPNDETQQKFLDCFFFNSQNGKFRLSNSGLGLCSVKRIVSILKVNTDITQLLLDANRINGEALSILISGIKQNTSIINLDLKCNDLVPSDMEFIFKELQHHPSIISLDISNIGGLHMNRIGLKAAEALRDYFMFNEIITVFKACTICLDDKCASIIFSGLYNNKSLLSLDISGNEIRDCSDFIYNILPTTQISDIYLNSNKFGDKGIQAMSQAFLKAKSDEYFQNLRKIHVANNGIVERAGEFLLSLLREKHIKELDFSKNGIGDSEFVKMRDFFAINNSLLIVNLSSCRLRKLGGNYLIEGLSKNTVLEVLDISDNEIGDEICQKIFTCLTDNIQLKEIICQKNKLGNNSMVGLAYLMEKAENLLKINLKDNYIQDDGAKKISTGLQMNFSVTNINLSFNLVSITMIKEIERKLRRNRTLLQREEIPRIKKNIIRLEHHVRQLPDLTQDFIAMDYRLENAMKNTQDKLAEVSLFRESSKMDAETTKYRKTMDDLEGTRQNIRNTYDSLTNEIKEEESNFYSTKLALEKEYIKKQNEISNIRITLNQTISERNSKKEELERNIDELWSKRREMFGKIKFMQELVTATQKTIEKVKLNSINNDLEMEVVNRFAENTLVARSAARNRTAVLGNGQSINLGKGPKSSVIDSQKNNQKSIMGNSPPLTRRETKINVDSEKAKDNIQLSTEKTPAIDDDKDRKSIAIASQNQIKRRGSFTGNLKSFRSINEEDESDWRKIYPPFKPVKDRPTWFATETPEEQSRRESIYGRLERPRNNTRRNSIKSGQKRRTYVHRLTSSTGGQKKEDIIEINESDI